MVLITWWETDGEIYDLHLCHAVGKCNARCLFSHHPLAQCILTANDALVHVPKPFEQEGETSVMI